MKTVKRIIDVIIFAAIIGVIIFTLRITKVDGESMNPTYTTNDKLLVYKDPNDLINIKNNSIITFKLNDIEYVKRVVAVPGDTITYDVDTLYVNDSEVCKCLSFVVEPGILKNDKYVVIGDNRDNSTDSRSFGVVDRSDITGIVLFKIM